MQTDNIYLGNMLGGGLLSATVDAGGVTSPVYAEGVGPAGRIFFHNIVPLTKGAANVAVLQASAAAVALTLAAGTGVTAGQAPDGSGAIVYGFDTPRCVSLTSTSNLSAVNYTITGYDFLGRRQTQRRAGPNNNTVNTLKAFASVLSVVPDASNAGTVSVGAADIFGLPWRINDAGLLVNVGWANALARDAGTFVAADATTPATNATGDPRGTYAPSSASDGSRRLVIAAHLDGTQCGAFATLANCLGVTPV